MAATGSQPRGMSAAEVEAFLTMLAVERKVSPSTHNQALSALLFLRREVLAIDLPWLNYFQRPAHRRRIPSVLTRAEVVALLTYIKGSTSLLARLLYGTGMRLMEVLRLRVKEVDFDRLVIIFHEAKCSNGALRAMGGKDRVVMLPRSLLVALRAQLLAARSQWESDRQRERDGVETPHALHRKYPNVGHTWRWFWMFPSPTLFVDPRSKVERRHHFLNNGCSAHSSARWLKRAFVNRFRYTRCVVHSPRICYRPTPTSHGGGAFGQFGLVHHHDLRTCSKSGGKRHDQPAGCAFSARELICRSLVRTYVFFTACPPNPARICASNLAA